MMCIPRCLPFPFPSYSTPTCLARLAPPQHAFPTDTLSHCYYVILLPFPPSTFYVCRFSLYNWPAATWPHLFLNMLSPTACVLRVYCAPSPVAVCRPPSCSCSRAKPPPRRRCFPPSVSKGLFNICSSVWTPPLEPFTPRVQRASVYRLPLPPPRYLDLCNCCPSPFLMFP